MTPQVILDFWFNDEQKPFWFAKSDEFDEKIRLQFSEIWQKAAHGELNHWRATIEGRLAEILVLDQFSRNLHRNSPLAFAQDGMALILSQEMLRQSEFIRLTETERQFALLPFMHSESREIHQQAVALFEKFTHQEVLDFELKHKAIIDRFGRYPHRNAILGRKNSEEEQLFLQQPDSGF